jgi:hypothetical protein
MCPAIRPSRVAARARFVKASRRSRPGYRDDVEASHRLHPASVLIILIACPIVSAVALAGIGSGVAVAVGSHHAVGIGAVIAACAFVANTAALCLALSRGEADARVVESLAAESVLDTAAYAQAS